LAEAKPLEAQFISRAASVDPQVQGQGFLFLISPNPSRLAPGAAVTGFIDVPGEKQAGVAVPRNAIVRQNGTAVGGCLVCSRRPETGNKSRNDRRAAVAF
jgi:hypothetical protein